MHGQTFKNVDQKLTKKLFKIDIKCDHLDFDNFNSSFILAQKNLKNFLKRKNSILQLFWAIDMKL